MARRVERMGLADDYVALNFDGPGGFLETFTRQMWQPGQHVALCGSTGCGKSTFAAHILATRKYVVALDPKGGDSTLGSLRKRGFVAISEWPPPKAIRRQIENGEPARLIVTHPYRTESDEAKLRELLRRTIDGVFEMGGWTLYVDELQVAADPGLMNLKKPIERNLIAARDRGVSVVTSFQQPKFVPSAASNQATYMVVWYTRDRDVVGRLSEMMGRDRAEIRGAVSALDPHCILVASNNPHDPVIATWVPKL